MITRTMSLRDAEALVAGRLPISTISGHELSLDVFRLSPDGLNWSFVVVPRRESSRVPVTRKVEVCEFEGGITEANYRAAHQRAIDWQVANSGLS